MCLRRSGVMYGPFVGWVWIQRACASVEGISCDPKAILYCTLFSFYSFFCNASVYVCTSFHVFFMFLPSWAVCLSPVVVLLYVLLFFHYSPLFCCVFTCCCCSPFQFHFSCPWLFTFAATAMWLVLGVFEFFLSLSLVLVCALLAVLHFYAPFSFLFLYICPLLHELFPCLKL